MFVVMMLHGGRYIVCTIRLNGYNDLVLSYSIISEKLYVYFVRFILFLPNTRKKFEFKVAYVCDSLYNLVTAVKQIKSIYGSI